MDCLDAAKYLKKKSPDWADGILRQEASDHVRNCGCETCREIVNLLDGIVPSTAE